MNSIIQKHIEKIRFGLIGIINTGIDFGILFTLVHFGLPTLVSNIISTSTALVFSFFANRAFTFKASDKLTVKQIVLFLVITLFGLWVIQPLIIDGIHTLLIHHQLSSTVVLLIGKLLATVATLIWNYLLYQKLVFKSSNQALDETIERAV